MSNFTISDALYIFSLVVPLHGDRTVFTKLGPQAASFIETLIIYTKIEVDGTTLPCPEIFVLATFNNRRKTDHAPYLINPHNNRY